MPIRGRKIIEMPIATIARLLAKEGTSPVIRLAPRVIVIATEKIAADETTICPKGRRPSILSSEHFFNLSGSRPNLETLQRPLKYTQNAATYNMNAIAERIVMH